MVIIQAKTWNFTKLFCLFVRQFAVSLSAFWNMSFHVVGERSSGEVRRFWVSSGIFAVGQRCDRRQDKRGGWGRSASTACTMCQGMRHGEQDDERLFFFWTQSTTVLSHACRVMNVCVQAICAVTVRVTMWRVTKCNCPHPLSLRPVDCEGIEIMESIALAFPMWQMYSAKSSGNSMLSCHVGSTRLPLECPWIALKYKKCMEDLGLKHYWNLFFGPPPFRQESSPSINCPFRRTINFTAPSSRGIAKSCRSKLIMEFDTAKQPCWMVLNRNSNKRQCHSKLWSLLSLHCRFPCTDKFNAFNKNFWRFCDVFVDTVHDTNPRAANLTHHQSERGDFPTVTHRLTHVQNISTCELSLSQFWYDSLRVLLTCCRMLGLCCALFWHRLLWVFLQLFGSTQQLSSHRQVGWLLQGNPSKDSTMISTP